MLANIGLRSDESTFIVGSPAMTQRSITSMCALSYKEPGVLRLFAADVDNSRR